MGEGVERGTLTKIAQHSTWKKLLYFNGDQSEILSETFFLSPQGHIDLQAELESTLSDYFKSRPENPNEHAICRFPARYAWLDSYLKLPDFKKRLSEYCHYLQNWGSFDKQQSISLVMVSGFLGNPASSFGHAFMKLNAKSKREGIYYFDQTINYGAQVPKNEPIMRYVYKGIFGGYAGRYTDDYFFSQDHVYTRTEFRDMWEFTLNLTPWEMEFLLLHAWEIRGYEFQYYFFDKNCAYRIAQLIDLISDSHLADHYRPWYLPEYLFLALSDAKNSVGEPLIKKIDFRPSSQRQLYSQLGLLTKEEIKLAKQVISNELEIKEALNKFEEKRKILFLDTLLSYVKYYKIANNDDALDSIKRLERTILVNRLLLPMSKQQKGEANILPTVQKYNHSSYVSIGSLNYNAQQGYAVNFGAFKRDGMTRNNLEGNELNVLNFSWIYLDDNFKLNDFELLRASNLKPTQFDLAEDKKWSWRAIVGATRSPNDDLPLFLKFAIGKSISAHNEWLSYAMLQTTVSTNDDMSGVSGLWGLKFQHKKLNFFSEIEGFIFNDEYGKTLVKSGFFVPLSPNVNWINEYRNGENESFSSALYFYF